MHTCYVCGKITNKGRFIDGSIKQDIVFVNSTYKFKYVCSFECYLTLMSAVNEKSKNNGGKNHGIQQS